jgi:hypothetical protein
MKFISRRAKLQLCGFAPTNVEWISALDERLQLTEHKP